MRRYIPLAALILVAAASRADEPKGSGAHLIKIRPGQVAAYEGKVQVREIVGGNVATENNYQASLVIESREDEPGKLRVHAVRLLRPEAADQQAFVGFDDAELEAGAGGPLLKLPEGRAAELEDGGAQLEAYLPLYLAPAFSVPQAGATDRGDAEVSVLGLGKVTAPFVRAALKKGDFMEVSRELPPEARPSFKVHEQGAQLLGWMEKFVVPAQGGLPHRIESSASVELQLEEDSKMRIERALTLKLKVNVEPGADGTAANAPAGKELRSISRDFFALKAADDIAKRVEAFSRMAKNPLYEPAAEALKVRLASYRSMGIGKPAHDFTLESLDGKQVSFREATKGKVILLSFWGVG